MQCTSILGNPQHTLGVTYWCPQMWHHWHSRAPWALRIVVPMSLNTHITRKPSTHTGRYVSSSPNVVSLAFPCSMGVTYRHPHESQCTHNLGSPQHTLGITYRRPQVWRHWHTRALWALRIAVPKSFNATLWQLNWQWICITHFHGMGMQSI